MEPQDCFCKEDKELLDLEYLDEKTEFECANKENFCPRDAKYFFEVGDERVGLCEGCYRDYQRGAFDRSKSLRKSPFSRIMYNIKEKLLSY